MFGLTYDLWQEIVDSVVESHSDLFSAIHRTADDIEISRPLIESLRRQGAIDLGDPWHFHLELEPLDDDIGGFRILLVAEMEAAAFEEAQAEAAADRGISYEEIEGFEIEHGLELEGDILGEIEERYDLTAHLVGDRILLQLVIFDSRDIDRSPDRVLHRGTSSSS